MSHFEAKRGIDPDELGYRAWNNGLKLNANPFRPGSEEAEMWEAGWYEARDNNSQFGVGA
jgi:hypothetical protein